MSFNFILALCKSCNLELPVESLRITRDLQQDTVTDDVIENVWKPVLITKCASCKTETEHRL